MLVYFGMKKFVIMTGLNCHHTLNFAAQFKKSSESFKIVEKHEKLLKLIEKCFREKDLIVLLNLEEVPKSCKKSLCIL